MPIRLNLLAEARALEEARRRDPVKRGIWIGGLLVTLMLVWSSSVQVKTMIAKRGLSQVENQIGARTNKYRVVQDNQRKVDEIRNKLTSLHQLTANRFQQGTFLNALQQTTVEEVQLTRVKVEQIYFSTEETKPKTNSEGQVTLGKPPTARESISVTLVAKDSGAVPGDQIKRFKEVVSTNMFFQIQLGRTNAARLAFVGTPTPPAQGDSKPFLPFTMECKFPEKTR